MEGLGSIFFQNVQIVTFREMKFFGRSLELVHKILALDAGVVRVDTFFCLLLFKVLQFSLVILNVRN